MSQKLPLGRRRRRLYWTVGILLTVAFTGIGIGTAVYLARQPGIYRTGEDHAEITRALDLGLPADAPQLRLTDVTTQAGLGEFRTFAGERSSQLPEDMGPGAAWGDYDGDGDDDLFLVSTGGPLTAPEERLAPSRLYENRGDGTFAAVGHFPETRIIGMGAAWGDHDGDGDLDLVVTGFDALRLFRNEGGTLVADSAIEPREGFWAGASWSDFDRDGDLDLYVCGYVQYVRDDGGRSKASKQYGRSVPYTMNPASYPPARNLLFRNRGDGTFDEVAEDLGLSNPDGRSLGALWHDLDEDGWPDLYVANDISDNALYLNREGRFEDVSHAAWVADYRGAMGLAAGDWNRDGDDDLVVTHWVAQENALYDSQLVNLRQTDPEAALRFIDVADQRGLGQIALRRVGWGAEFGDLDGDGWLDLVVANGSTFEEDGEPRRLTPEPSFVFWNQQGQHFHDLAPLQDAVVKPHVSRGVALSDYDRDGDLDMLFVDNGGGVRLLRNDMQVGNWIELRLRAASSSSQGHAPADGARVIARVGDATLRRTVSSVSYLSQSTRVVHFGLGEAKRVDRIEVWWPTGAVEEYGPLEAGVMWELREGDPSPERAPAVAAPLTREQTVEFWNHQRAAMDAMKVDNDIPRAMNSFRAALALNPAHEDSIYYLGNCFATQGDPDSALDRFAELIQRNPMSHRGLKRWGTLRAMTAASTEELSEAEEMLGRAVAVNPEETGAPLVLAEIAVIRNSWEDADERLQRILHTNPGAADAMFLRGYVAWRAGDQATARSFLKQSVGDAEPWHPESGVAEGETKKVMHTDQTLLRRFIENPRASTDPEVAFVDLDGFLRERRQELDL